MASEPAPVPSEPDVDIMNAPSADTGEEPHCRICRSEGTPEEPLYHPCKCSGSIKYVHQECLMEWLQHSQKKYCELCKTPFTFTKVYDPEMPATLPTPLFLKQAARYALSSLGLWARGALVVAVWLGCLPWAVRWMWQGWFWMSDGGWWALKPSGSLLAQTTPRESAPTQSITTPTQGSLLGQLVPALKNAVMTPATAGNETTGNATGGFDPFEYRDGLFFDSNPFGNVTNSHRMNRMLADILEGQLLTALIVVSFIIIFLIREWVVQQQPAIDALNLPALDPNPVEEEAAALEEAREEARREMQAAVAQAAAEIAEVQGHDGNVLWEREREPEPEVPGQPRVIARPRRRRVFPADQEGEERAGGEGGAAADEGDEAEGAMATGSIFGDAATRPQPTRFNTSQATNVRREIEESTRVGTPAVEFEFGVATPPAFNFGGPSIAGSSAAGSREEAPTAQETMDSEQPENAATGPAVETHQETSPPDAPAFSPEPVPEPATTEAQGEVATVGTTETNSNNSTWGSDNSFEMIFGPKDDEPITADNTTRVVYRPGPDGEPEAVASSSRYQEDRESEWEDEEDESKPEASTAASVSAGTATPATNDTHPLGPQPALAPEVEERPRRLNNPGMERAVRPTMAQMGPGELDTMLNNLERMEGEANGNQQDADGRGDEQAAHAVPEAPPPMPPAEAAAEADVEDEEEDNALFNADEDPAIPDDDAADDLEGIMELVGMRGPLAGLIQNAAISSMLITGTVAIGVAFPYVCGKTMMMILAHPVLLLVKLPKLIFQFTAELAVDLATWLMAGALLSFDNIFQFFAKPISFAVPSLRMVIEHKALTTILDNWAHGAWSRVLSKFEMFHTTYGAVRQYPPTAVPPLSMVAGDAMDRFWATMDDVLGRLGLAGVLSPPLSLGPEKFELAGMSVVNPVVWATHVFEETFAAVNFTKAENVSAVLYNATAPVVGDAKLEPYTIYRWTALDRVAVVLLGYLTFTMVGMVYVRRRRNTETSGLERHLVDFLEQSGGVMKVVLIIGIEMFLFPLYCGLLLDIAVLPLFAGATVAGRVQFTIDFPLTSIFVHWFVGTCYMFHFALFVSMCRKIMRKGVLHFIRDPDDPTFHPVRDVLDRPVITQLRKILFSGVIYGVLVIVCLGSVVWGLHGITSNILPIHWSSTEAILEFPVDLMFYNLLMPITVKYFKPSTLLQSMYDAWFRLTARGLRLSSFLFGDRHEDEEGSHRHPNWPSLFRRERGDISNPVLPGDTRPENTVFFERTGRYVRAPASDSVRRPRGSTVFIPVDEHNHRTDLPAGIPDPTEGSRDWEMVYIPPHFRLRIALLIFSVWAFAALTGVAATIGPLLLGRTLLSHVVPPHITINDIYAFSFGAYILAGVGYALYSLNASRTRLLSWYYSARYSRTKITSATVILQRVGKLLYLAVAGGVILPTLIALLIQFYIIIPLHVFFTPPSSPSSAGSSDAADPERYTLHFIQDYTLGLLYLKLSIRLLLLSETFYSRQLRAIVQDGWYNPNIKLATRVFIVPMVAVGLAGLVGPLVGARMWLGMWGGEERAVYRMAFPVAMGVGMAGVGAWGVKRVVEGWGGRVRDEVYLRGVVVHNFGEKAAGVRA